MNHTTLAIVDYNRTIYDPDADELIEGAETLLQRLRGKGVTLVLVSRREGGREDRLRQLGVAEFFSEILFVEQKTESLFRDIISRYARERNYVIGDHLYQEIRSGNLAGAHTIQFKKGRFAGLKPEGDTDVPHSVVVSLLDVLDYI